jgi:hypothetical protein
MSVLLFLFDLVWASIPLRKFSSNSSWETFSKSCREIQNFSFFSLWLYSPSDLCRFFSFLIYTQSVGLLGRGNSPSQGRWLHTELHKHRINAHRHPCLERDSKPRLQCSSGRRRFMPWLRSHCDRLEQQLYWPIISRGLHKIMTGLPSTGLAHK